MSFPKVVALDTDWTIWENYLDRKWWGKGLMAHGPVEDSIEPVDQWLLRDRTNHYNWIRVYNDISEIVNDVLKNGAKLAIVSRNSSKAMCDRALSYFKTTNPADGKECPIIHLVQYDEVVDESKVQHFRRIQAWSGSDFSDLLFFDDEAFNNVVRVELGVPFQLVRDKRGLTWDVYQQGLEAWRRAKSLHSIISQPSRQRRRKLIGYSGLSTQWIDLVRKGEGLVDRTMPARWGYALYVASSVAIAKYFRDWTPHKSYVCEVWVKDYEAWTKINKIWVPENDGSMPQMNNMIWSAEQSGRNQEDRDRLIAEQWNVQTPYVLFSRHHWMLGMPQSSGERWSEMAVYTQIQRSLFEVVPLSDDEAERVDNPCPFPFHHQFKPWGITIPDATRQEFLKYNEIEFYRLSA